MPLVAIAGILLLSSAATPGSVSARTPAASVPAVSTGAVVMPKDPRLRRFFTACLARRPAEVRRMLDGDRSLVNARDGSGLTALLDLAPGGDSATAGVLLAHGADVDRTSADGFNALHVTCYSG